MPDVDALPEIIDDELAQYEERETPADVGTEAPPVAEAAPSQDASAVPSADAAPRDEQGRFKPKPDAPAGDALPAKTPAAQPAAIPGAPAAPTAPAPSWSPFVVPVDKEREPVELKDLGAQILREGGHAMLILPDDKLQRFQQLVGRGVHYERSRRDFDAEKAAFQVERSKPQPPSDAEIEAKTLLEVLKPQLAELFDQPTIDWLADKVELAKLKSGQTFAQEQQKRETESKQTAEIETAKDTGLANAVVQVWTTQKAALPGLTEQDVQAAYRKLVPFKNALWTQENGEWFINTEAIHAELKERSDAKTALATATKKAEDAAKFNARQAAPVVTPPAPTRKAGVTVPGKVPANHKEFDEAKFLRGGYDTE